MTKYITCLKKEATKNFTHKHLTLLNYFHQKPKKKES